MLTIRTPAACIALIAASRPLPGPFTKTSTVRIPCSIANRADSAPARWAAKAVDFLEPLKPIEPALVWAMTSPFWSVMLMSVLLKVELM